MQHRDLRPGAESGFEPQLGMPPALTNAEIFAIGGFWDLGFWVRGLWDGVFGLGAAFFVHCFGGAEGGVGLSCAAGEALETGGGSEVQWEWLLCVLSFLRLLF